ncbi:cytochrome P450 [Jimgerdemannia flammicorona]|uniref:Cytochrome P450 n=1 Tax=Jimgerdemannia flammicorona TaxID=994334 RepID=A0A433PC58_9FUNG|nr:cytochrome P450 [Jimgerdemannia flammicorona]
MTKWKIQLTRHCRPNPSHYSETTSNTTLNIAYALATNPIVQTRFHAEIDSILGLLAFSNSVDVPYTYSILRESLRLHPVAPIHGMEARVDTVVQGHLFPKGTNSLLMIRAAALR